ncbi:Biotin biosynthesis cytochrome P450 [Vibrio ruber DSM 16370]|uniref:Biotin biosynthesis cytochrome P450 n=1 Tax=Vibrio ruber (strain DSM 16370 / JCM 11486 / BCRC 17186 / CECT 7878 / LMG 23124 / VR1) TaxID=1123498 RepID=A0A1R4LRB0_VIBR1|nr:cytochrome P450 [Vibrio ruber]SJN59055.1 Biotin biosynthesis cytochrome P450 [Vibrio ruber DSM 16370]
MNTQILNELIFNPTDKDFLYNPYPFYRCLRCEDPIHYSSLGFWLVTRHKDIEDVLRNKFFGKNFGAVLEKQLNTKIADEPALKMINLQVLMSNPPAHTRLRKLIMTAFVSSSIKKLQPMIEETANMLIDRVEAEGSMDIMKNYAERLPLMVICKMLGIDAEADMDFFVSRIPSRLLDLKPVSREELDEINQDVIELSAYIKKLCDERRVSPKDDLITHMVHAREDGDILSDDELVANIMLTLGAGYETTTSLISNALLLLFRHKESLEQIKADPSLTANAIEEALRYEPPVQIAARTALEDTSIDGQVIKKGETVILVLSSANRDEEVYSNPDIFDIYRENIRPISFGGGAHLCLGAQLSRVESAIAINTILKRLPHLSLDDVEQPNWSLQFTRRILNNLIAHW